MGTDVSAVIAVALALVAALLWVVREVAKQVITREVDWWAPRLEALLARVAALVAPPKHRRKGLHQQWRAELDVDRLPGETRVLMAADYIRASVRMWRRAPRDDDAAVTDIQAADGATVTHAAAVVVQLKAEIHATGELTATVIRAADTGAGTGGATAHGIARSGGSANLGGGAGLSAHGAARSGGSATLRFHSDIMERLAKDDYPAVNRRYFL